MAHLFKCTDNLNHDLILKNQSRTKVQPINRTSISFHFNLTLITLTLIPWQIDIVNSAWLAG